MDLTTAQLDRACGVLLASAVGDALDAGYTSGTSQTLEIQDTLITTWTQWTKNAGNTDAWTRNISSAVRNGTIAPAPVACLPMALAFLNEPDGLTQAATTLGTLTNSAPEASEACVLWSHAIRHAVLTGDLDARAGLERLPEPSRSAWAKRLTAAERTPTPHMPRDDGVVQAIKTAWHAIATTEIPDDDPATGSFRADHLRRSLDNTAHPGRDTAHAGRDTAAIAGGLLGATYGASAVPARWRLDLRSQSGLSSRDLITLATTTATGRTFTRPVYGAGNRPAVTEPHPDDAGLLLADIAALHNLPAAVTAVVSLCQVGEQHEQAILARTPRWLQVRLADTDDPTENQNLDFVLHDTVTAIEELRSEGHVVLVHCVAAYSRTPTIGALYAMRRTGTGTGTGTGIDQAIAAMDRTLPEADPTDAFRQALNRTQPPNNHKPDTHRPR